MFSIIPPKWVIQWPLEQRADEICMYQLPKNQKQQKSHWSPNFTLEKWGKTQEGRTVCWKLDNWINLRNQMSWCLAWPSWPGPPSPRYCGSAKDFILDTTSIYACHYSILSLTCLGKHVKLIHPRMFYCNKAKASSSNFVPVPCCISGDMRQLATWGNKYEVCTSKSQFLVILKWKANTAHNQRCIKLIKVRYNSCHRAVIW